MNLSASQPKRYSSIPIGSGNIDTTTIIIDFCQEEAKRTQLKTSLASRRLPSSPSPAWSRSSASSTPLATRLSDLDRCACTPYTRTEHLDRFTHANFSLRPLVCHVAMAAQAMSMVARFDSSFLCRLGASVELLHHLARPSREDAMHRAHSDVCTRHRMPCCTCCSQQIWIDLSLH